MSTPAEPGNVHREQVTVRRSPRFLNFGLIGVVLGVLAAMVFTFSFEENEEYTRMQVFGFLLLICLTVGIAIMMVVAIVLERVVGRRTVAAVADRIDVNDAVPADAPTGRSQEPGSDTAEQQPGTAEQAGAGEGSTGPATTERSVDN